MGQRTVWKFELHHERNPEVQMPKDARLVHVDIHDEKLFVWAIVDPEAPLETRAFTVLGTGDMLGVGAPDSHSYSPESAYVGTVPYKAMVWHVFQGRW